MTAMSLNPAQQEVLDQLGATASQRPSFDAELRHELRAQLEHAVVDLADPDAPLHVDKRALTLVHGCRRRAAAERAENTFEPSVAVARGAVAHKAVELAVWWRGVPEPVVLVDEAMARLEHDNHWLSDWLMTCADAERAELRGQATDRVSKFIECWPPLKPAWRPVTESRVRVSLADDTVRLTGKIDLSLGRAEGTTAGKVLLDLKTGNAAAEHLDDLRFYALLETIKIGTPPRLVASYYLDEGRLVPETVTTGTLDAALARTVDGIRQLAALPADPTLAPARPGAGCRFCPLADTCAGESSSDTDLEQTYATAS